MRHWHHLLATHNARIVRRCSTVWLCNGILVNIPLGTHYRLWGIHVTMPPCLDYCNSVIYSISNGSVQREKADQNAAARLVTWYKTQQAHQQLHWLSVHQRIKFQLTVLVNKSLHSTVAGQRLSTYCCDRPVVINCDHQTLLRVSFLVALLVPLIRRFPLLVNICETLLLLFYLCRPDLTLLQFSRALRPLLLDSMSPVIAWSSSAKEMSVLIDLLAYQWQLGVKIKGCCWKV